MLSHLRDRQRGFVQSMKDHLVRLGPRHPATRLTLAALGRCHGVRVTVTADAIVLQRAAHQMRVAHRDAYLVPYLIGALDQFVATVQSKGDVLDFSRPGRHTVGGFTLLYPGIPEDESLADYTRHYTPQSGDLVFDVGAHAGLTAVQFAHLVGPTGRVIAFEPDPATLTYLRENVAAFPQITVAAVALDAATGTAAFNADGTMGAGLVAHSVYGHTGPPVAVPTLSFEEACHCYGVPAYAKLDIEGAEVEVIRTAQSFLAAHPIHLAFDSDHRRRDGQSTVALLEPLLRDAGYTVESARTAGQGMTWATPGGFTR